MSLIRKMVSRGDPLIKASETFIETFLNKLNEDILKKAKKKKKLGYYRFHNFLPYIAVELNKEGFLDLSYISVEPHIFGLFMDKRFSELGGLALEYDEDHVFYGNYNMNDVLCRKKWFARSNIQFSFFNDKKKDDEKSIQVPTDISDKVYEMIKEYKSPKKIVRLIEENRK